MHNYIATQKTLVAGNRELIARFEQKIQATLARVWGEEVPDGVEARALEAAS